MLKPGLIIIGHIMIKTIYMGNGSIIGPVLKSPVAYSSVAASSLDTKTGLVTAIGKDMPYYIASPIIEAEVDTKGICIKGKGSRSIKLTYDKDGNKKVYYEKVAPSILFEDISKEYLKSEAFFICPMDSEVPLEIISKLRRLSKLMMANLGEFGGIVLTMYPSAGSKKDKRFLKFN